MTLVRYDVRMADHSDAWLFDVVTEHWALGEDGEHTEEHWASADPDAAAEQYHQAVERIGG